MISRLKYIICISIVTGAVSVVVMAIKALLDSGWTSVGLVIDALPWFAVGAAVVFLLDMVQAREDE
jgi:hypothetical protein